MLHPNVHLTHHYQRETSQCLPHSATNCTVGSGTVFLCVDVVLVTPVSARLMFCPTIQLLDEVGLIWAWIKAKAQHDVRMPSKASFLPLSYSTIIIELHNHNFMEEITSYEETLFHCSVITTQKTIKVG